MNRTFSNKALRTGLILLSLGMGGTVLAETSPAPATPNAAGAEPGGWGDHKGQRLAERLAQLHSELKLTQAQEVDWKTWSDKVNQVKAEKREARPDFEALGKLPAPDRLQKMIEFSKARQAGMEEVLAATKTFYAALTPDQRKAFDDLTPFGARAPKWHHGGPRHPGGAR